MNNNEILETLSELEAVFYYRADGSDNAEGVALGDLKAMHEAVKSLLTKWHDLTGCTLA